ncbi:MAG: ABC transporter ATP-binding protein [Myxococcota bacterium]|nr:ABC transporter ATP-binding protein [Myxococcota bacterium]
MLRLDAQELAVTRGGNKIIQQVNLSLRGGELIALLGPSGSGKSTLLKALCGFSQGEGGVYLGNQELYSNFDDHRTKIGYVPQDDLVHQQLSVSATLDYASRLRLPPDIPDALRKAKVNRLLTILELAEHQSKTVRSLSGGQRKRVSVAVELLAEPPVLFLDEPTSGLDPALEAASMKLFRDLTTPQRITLVTTHVLTTLDCVDLVVFMCEGRVLFVGPPKHAATHFEVDHLLSIYKVLTSDRLEEHLQRFEESSVCREFVSERLRQPRESIDWSKAGQENQLIEHRVNSSGQPAAERSNLEHRGKTPEEKLQELKAQRGKGE